MHNSYNYMTSPPHPTFPQGAQVVLPSVPSPKPLPEKKLNDAHMVLSQNLWQSAETLLHSSCSNQLKHHFRVFVAISRNTASQALLLQYFQQSTETLLHK